MHWQMPRSLQEKGTSVRRGWHAGAFARGPAWPLLFAAPVLPQVEAAPGFGSKSSAGSRLVELARCAGCSRKFRSMLGAERRSIPRNERFAPAQPRGERLLGSKRKPFVPPLSCDGHSGPAAVSARNSPEWPRFSSRSAATELSDENPFHPRQFCLAITSTLTAVYAEVRYDMRIGRARQRWYRSGI